LPDVEGGTLPPGIRVQNGCDVRILRALGIVVVLSAGLEARLYGRQGCPPLQFKLDKFLGSAWLAAMKIPEFKPSKRFLGDIKLPCLVAKVKNSELGVASECLRAYAHNPECHIFLRGNDPFMISPWQRKILDSLFDKEGLRAAIDEGMKEYEASGGYVGLDKKELRKVKNQGFSPFLTIATIGIDEIAQEAVIYCKPDFDIHLDEHGLTIFLKEGRWHSEDGDYYARYYASVDEQVASKLKRFVNRLFKRLNSCHRSRSAA
jgi:hypothetical protein